MGSGWRWTTSRSGRTREDRSAATPGNPSEAASGSSPFLIARTAGFAARQDARTGATAASARRRRLNWELRQQLPNRRNVVRIALAAFLMLLVVAPGFGLAMDSLDRMGIPYQVSRYGVATVTGCEHNEWLGAPYTCDAFVIWEPDRGLKHATTDRKVFSTRPLSGEVRVKQHYCKAGREPLRPAYTCPVGTHDYPTLADGWLLLPLATVLALGSACLYVANRLSARFVNTRSRSDE
ncbi:hypothetical protein [Krasilnikovia sp. M28-CT-15]|uniref:hypothetical protein n=1 Tax=Krasilnikovia sp. M28-CT-15 TaxID=3373540 RepID=UPI0038764E81